MKNRFVIWGSSGHAKVLYSLIRMNGDELIAIFDNNPSVSSIASEIPVFYGKAGFEEWIKLSISRKSHVLGAVAVGGDRGKDRLEIKSFMQQYGITFPVLIHPTASVCSTAILEEGTQVLALSIIAADCDIGKASIINHKASVDHECRIGQGVHIAPGATLCGCITVGHNVLIGAGAVILPRLAIGDNTVVGAGSVVTKDLPENVVAYGNPAKIVRDRSNQKIFEPGVDL